MRLAVELHGTRVGTLEGDSRGFDFTPSDAGIERFGMNSTALSVAIPLVPSPRRDHARRRRNWFAELLPEGDQLDYMLQQGGVRRGDVLGFLARFGRDVAGALQVWDLDDPTEPRQPGTLPVSDAAIRGLLEDPVGSPLANVPGAGKSSLGGIQPKIVLARTSRGWAQAVGGHATTHILKPQLPRPNETVVFDEEYGSRIARGMGLAGFETWVDDFDGLPTLVIERYDRAGGGRIHQEDFNQALGAHGNEKYQEVGGVVSLKRVADVLQRHASEDDVRSLARMVVVAVGVGNLDMHSKNLGLLHPVDGPVRLAPAYDVVPQAHLQNDGRLALAVNGKYSLAEVTADDLRIELGSWGLARPSSVVDETLGELGAMIAEEVPLEGAFPGLQAQLAGFVNNLQSGRAARSV